MTAVSDASPLIFLGKVGRLDLVSRLLGPDILIPNSVRDELLAPGAALAETLLLRGFLERCTVLAVGRPVVFASGLSRADNDVVTLAIRKHAEILLCDDRIVREVAALHGVRPIGTLGVLLQSMKKRFLAPSEVRKLVDTLVREHRFRIGIEVYERVLASLAELAGSKPSSK